MDITFYSLMILGIIASLLPFIPHKHWVFRVPEFLKLQLLSLQILVVITGLFFWEQWHGLWFYIGFAFTLLLILHHLYDLFPFSIFYRWFRPKKQTEQRMSKPIKLISSNVYQFNQSYDRLIHLIDNEQPDLVLTMESNADWEKALRQIEKDYPYQVKETQENTYGMHLYSKLKIKNFKIHFFINRETPSFEVHFETDDNYRFDFFGVHPPPPSPTEEENSKERDGELMRLSKRIRERKNTNETIVVGDFNNVAWASSTQRFRRLTGLIDPRFGRGLLCTFHAKIPLLRMPIDLMYHGESIYVKSFERLPSINSDHFPLCCTFQIAERKVEESTEEQEKGDQQLRDEEIKEGLKQAQSTK